MSWLEKRTQTEKQATGHRRQTQTKKKGQMSECPNEIREHELLFQLNGYEKRHQLQWPNKVISNCMCRAVGILNNSEWQAVN